MKKNMLLRFSVLVFMVSLIFSNTFAQLSGTYTLPGTVNATTVNNLTQLATLLNSSTVNGNVVFEFTSSYVSTGETYPIIFTAYGGSGTVTIRPAASVSTPLITSGSPASQAIVSLNGVTNLTFDGRPGGAGTAQDWTFSNITNGSSYPVFLFTNGAQYDALKYITVQGSCTNTTGNINFGTTTGSGNSYDTIANCKVTNYAAYSYIQIYSNGTTGNPNSNNSIVNNSVSNFQAYNGSGAPTQGGVIITTTGNGSNWNISGNSIFCAGAPNLYSAPIGGISFAAGVNSTNNIISGNYIGGQQPLCAGGKMKIVSYQANGYPDFDGIYNNSGSVTINNNTIQNIYMGSSYGSSTFCGINISGSGSAVVTNNVIGNPTDTGNIVSGINGTMLGIYNHSSGGAVTIDHNTVANLTADYRAYVSGTSSQTSGAITGIYNYGGSGGNIGATSITNNKVFNLTTASNYNNNLYFYINTSGNNGANFPASTYNNPQNNVVCGIFMEQDNTTTNTQLISKNTVYGLASTITGGSFISYISGIVANGATSSTNIINGNQMYGFYAPNTYGTSGTYYIGLTGIYLPTSKTGKYYVQDNIVDLGTRPTDGSSVQNALIYGIWENNYSQNSTNLKEYILHNSVYVGGSDNSAVYSFAFARNLFYSSTVYDSLTIMNNIFVNNRTSTNTNSRAYGLYLNSTIDVINDYNDVYGTGAHYYYGAANGTSYATQALYLAANTGHETNGIAADPQYTSPTATTPNLHISNTPTQSPIEQAGTPAYTIVYDYDSLIRANFTPVDLGATVSCSSSPATVALTVSQDTICPGISVTFTATATNGGTPVYTFYKNGTSVQSGASNVYTTSALANNDSVKVLMVGNSPCASSDTAYSSAIIISVNASGVTPTVTLGVSQNNICANTSVTFTATGTNGGTAPIYRFYKNNVLVQSSSANIYSNGALANGDAVKVVLVSNTPCASPDSAVSTTITMSITTPVTPTVAVSPSVNNVCAGTQITLTATATNGGAAPVYTFYKNGTSVQSGAGNTYSSTTLANNDSVWVVLTSNATCVTTTTATSTKVHLVINAAVTPSVTIGASQNNICTGTSVTFTATATNGGSSPIYNFYVNGSSVQNGASNTYSSTTLNNNDSVWVVLTSNAACASPTTATSTKVHMVIVASVTPTVSLSPSQNNICPGTSVTFTATATNGGTAPTYHFYVNGASVQNGASNTYSSTTLANGNTVKVSVTSNATCRSIDSAVSSTVTMVVTSAVVPTVTITPTSSTICSGTSVTFTATATGGGSAPVYHFYVDGTSVQNGASNTYTSTLLSNNDSVWVVLTSNSACASPTTATSTKAHISVSATVTPSVNIGATQIIFCAGTSVTFTANPTNGGTTPIYRFYVNGVSVQSSASATYTSSILNNNDLVRIEMISNANCRTADSASSPTLTMFVNSNVTPTVTITPSTNGICAGTSVTFNTTVTNGGTTPTYNFYVNGVSVQNGAGNSYTSTTLHNNDSVWVVLTSTATCATPAAVTSSKVHLSVTAAVVPSVTLSASQSNICAGAQVIFTAVATNGGTTPTYTFYRNGTSVQSGAGATYTNSALGNNDSVWVVLTSNATCVSPATAQSTKVHITVGAPVTPTVVLNTSNASICAGQSVTYTATATNGGTAPAYQFFVNGVSVQSSAANTYSSTSLTNGAVVKVTLTSNAACVTQATVSDSLTVTVHAPGASSQSANLCVSGGVYQFYGRTLTTAGTYYDTLHTVFGCDSMITLTLTGGTPAAVQLTDSVCPGGTYFFDGRTLTTAGVYRDTLHTVNGCDSIVTLTLSIAQRPVAVVSKFGTDSLYTTPFASYQWLFNNAPINGAISESYIATRSGSYAVVVTNALGCKDTSVVYSFIALGLKDVNGSTAISIYPNPTSGELNIHLEGYTGSEISFRLYDMQGQGVSAPSAIATSGSSYVIDISAFAAGVYYLHIQGSDLSEIRKVEVIK